MDELYDLIIVGAGISGSLVAHNTHKSMPHWKILLLEKEACLGGRLRQTQSQQGIWSYGLNTVSPDLSEFLEASNLDHIAQPNPSASRKLGVLAAGKITEVPLEEAFTAKGAKAIAGAAAARDWSLIDEFISQRAKSTTSDTSFSNSWKGTKKSPSAIVLEHLARLQGIPDIWSASANSISELMQTMLTCKPKKQWEAICHNLLKTGVQSENIKLEFSSEVVEAHQKDNIWQVSSMKGQYTSKRLIVSHNPWDAFRWLPKDYWPSKIASVAAKTKPVSVVLLSTKLDTPPTTPLPDTILVPAESAQIYINQEHICIQATLNFELTLQAPEVVKAIKRLKRAKKKLLSYLSDASSEGEHLALLPVGWSQPLQPAERRIIAKINDSIQGQELGFCGDAYGPEVISDKNVISSCLAVCKKMTAHAQSK